jgi:hypothetical protein
MIKNSPEIVFASSNLLNSDPETVAAVAAEAGFKKVEWQSRLNQPENVGRIILAEGAEVACLRQPTHFRAMLVGEDATLTDVEDEQRRHAVLDNQALLMKGIRDGSGRRLPGLFNPLPDREADDRVRRLSEVFESLFSPDDELIDIIAGSGDREDAVRKMSEELLSARRYSGVSLDTAHVRVNKDDGRLYTVAGSNYVLDALLSYTSQVRVVIGGVGKNQAQEGQEIVNGRITGSLRDKLEMIRDRASVERVVVDIREQNLARVMNTPKNRTKENPLLISGYRTIAHALGVFFMEKSTRS